MYVVVWLLFPVVCLFLSLFFGFVLFVLRFMFLQDSSRQWKKLGLALRLTGLQCPEFKSGA